MYVVNATVVGSVQVVSLDQDDPAVDEDVKAAAAVSI